jgi:predicted nucleic acid-binding protein
MNVRYLLDANVLVYALDHRESQRRERAQEVIRRTALSSSAALPVQALSEFSNVCLRKLLPPLAAEDVRLEVERLTWAFPVLTLTAPIVGEALRGVRDHNFSYYYSQVWALARLAQVPVILSEDFNSGVVVEGVRFLDPFDLEFELEILS